MQEVMRLYDQLGIQLSQDDTNRNNLQKQLGSFASGLIPEAVSPFKAFTVSRCKVGSYSRPNPPKSPCLSPGWARGEAGQSPQVQQREDDSLSSAGLSSSCVALRLSASGFPGAVVAVTPSTTQRGIIRCQRPSPVARLLTPRRRALAHRRGANAELTQAKQALVTNGILTSLGMNEPKRERA
ncbi:unnamed protein product [Pleuronectes platessa]|uniref:Uncharacterized protein n=1 Tax=Pleuronectes platessa TaxID=8262 RepID=A0A9N7USX0_PLEPL|nr:unnamed protein product [Pleuronectes platessa]